MTLTASDLDTIMESLRETQGRFQQTTYPTYEFKQQRLADLAAVIEKVAAMRREGVAT